MTRYEPARQYVGFGATAAALAGLSGWFGWYYSSLSYIAAGLFLITAGVLFAMACLPAIEIHEGYVSIGKRIVPWMDIRSLDRTGWVSPLINRITLFDDTRFPLVRSDRKSTRLNS